MRDDRPLGDARPGGALLCFARSAARTSRAAPSRVHRLTAGRCVQRLQRAVQSYAPSETNYSALCWAHARRQFFELADIAANDRRGKKATAISPIALEAVKRIDALFDIERGINGHGAEERLRVRREQSAPLLAALEAWLREQRPRLSRSSSVAEPIDYMLRRWDRFTSFIDDGRVCLTNNAAERALRGFALGRKSWLFAGSEREATCRRDGDADHDRQDAAARRGEDRNGSLRARRTCSSARYQDLL